MWIIRRDLFPSSRCRTYWGVALRNRWSYSSRPFCGLAIKLRGRLVYLKCKEGTQFMFFHAVFMRVLRVNWVWAGIWHLCARNNKELLVCVDDIDLSANSSIPTLCVDQENSQFNNEKLFSFHFLETISNVGKLPKLKSLYSFYRRPLIPDYNTTKFIVAVVECRYGVEVNLE